MNKSIWRRIRKDLRNVFGELETVKEATQHNPQRIKEAKRIGRTKPWQKGNVWHIRHDYLKELHEHAPKLMSCLDYPRALLTLTGWIGFIVMIVKHGGAE